MMIYMQRSRKDGQQSWREGVEATQKSICVDNIMETIERKHSITEDEQVIAKAALEVYGRCHVDTTTYDILELDEDEQMDEANLREDLRACQN